MAAFSYCEADARGRGYLIAPPPPTAPANQRPMPLFRPRFEEGAARAHYVRHETSQHLRRRQAAGSTQLPLALSPCRLVADLHCRDLVHGHQHVRHVGSWSLHI